MPGDGARRGDPQEEGFELRDAQEALNLALHVWEIGARTLVTGRPARALVINQAIRLNNDSWLTWRNWVSRARRTDRKNSTELNQGPGRALGRNN